MAYDPANQLLYVLDYGSNSVSVVDTATSAVVAKITVGQSPSSIMFDPFNQMIYVTNFISSDITVIDTRTNGVAYSIDTGNLSSPQSVVYNPANGTIYSLDMGTANLSEINPGTGKILLNVSLGHDEMFDLAFDPINRFLYVTDVANDTVLALDTNSNRIVGYAKVQSFPEAINYDPSTGYLYVSNAGASTVSDLGTSPFETIANVSLPSYAKSLAWNPFNGFEYACSVSGAGSTSNNPPDIFLINSSLAVNLSMNVGGLNASLTDIVFNTAFHSMYVSDGAFDLVWEIALPTAVHRVNFTESNLPPGTSWYANLSNGDLLNSEVANLSLEIPQGTYAYTISTVDKSYMARGGQLQVQN